MAFSPSEGRTVIGSVRAIAKGGAGIVDDGGRTVFLPGVVAGETVEFAVSGRRRSAWQGRLLRVLEPSPQRAAPPCPHYGECGGCNLQHMNYGEQLRVKADILLGNLKKFAALPEPPTGFAVLASPPWRYRSKVEFQVAGGAAGFFARESQRVVAIGSCRLLPEVVEAFFLARRPGGSGQMQVVSNGSEVAGLLRRDAGPSEWLTPQREVQLAVGAHAYAFAPDTFVQANLFQLPTMLGLLEGVLEQERPQVAVDLFCGAGFFTLPLAARCREVLAVDSDPANAAALRANLDRCRGGGVRVLQADALRSPVPPCDLAVVDPPRGGLSSWLIGSLAASRAATVVYFSCDSATFARDLRLFLGHGFRLSELKLVDNFPQSDHCEIFSVLKRTELRDA